MLADERTASNLLLFCGVLTGAEFWRYLATLVFEFEFEIFLLLSGC